MKTKQDDKIEALLKRIADLEQRLAAAEGRICWLESQAIPKPQTVPFFPPLSPPVFGVPQTPALPLTVGSPYYEGLKVTC